MTVAGVFHLVLAQNVIGPVMYHDFVAFKQTVRHLVIVTAANQEEPSRGGLHALEIVGEVLRHGHLVLYEGLGLEDVLVNELGIALENEQALDELRILDGVWLKHYDVVLLFDCAALTETHVFMVLKFLALVGFEAIGAFELEFAQ